MPPLQPACAGAQRGDRKCRGIVDIERQIGQPLAGIGQRLEILAADLAHAQRFGRNARLFGQDTRGELILAHFEAEHGDAGTHRFLDPVLDVALQPRGAIVGDVHRQR